MKIPMPSAVLRGSALAALVLGFACTVLAQSYPTRPIKVIVPYPPGDAADILAEYTGCALSGIVAVPIDATR